MLNCTVLKQKLSNTVALRMFHISFHEVGGLDGLVTPKIKDNFEPPLKEHK